MVESRGDIIPRPSQLELDVRLSPHPAPDVLGLRLCSCEYNRGSFHELLEGCFSSSYCDFHQCDVDVLSLHLAFLIHNVRMNGFAFLRL